MKMTRGDLILIILVIVLSLSSMVFAKTNLVDYNDKYISIQVNGKEYKKIIFDNSVIGNQYPIETEFGYNLVEVGDGEVWVVEASCPDKIDVLQGKISKPGEMIVCLPNRLVIEIKGTSEEREVDHISY